MRSALDDGHFVVLSDWRGRCVWTNSEGLRIKVGEFLWAHLAAESIETAKAALGRVVALREAQQLEVRTDTGDIFRGWLWPLDSPDIAVCVLGIGIPRSLALLTAREIECLGLVAKGIETRLIAAQLDVSVSTIQTHLKRAREKLGLLTSEALASFAARYCYPLDAPLVSRAS
jgi:DNA-binding CsgD family transcriptional regulator